MRLLKGVPVAGVDPAVARDLMRACHHRPQHAGEVADEVGLPETTVRKMLRQLVDGGYLDQQRDGAGNTWFTTISGNALAMASFLKPIPRAKADKLLAGVLERAAAYTADETKAYTIELSIFGSYLEPDVMELGDLDLALKWQFRAGVDALDYAAASGRRFASFIDRLCWAEKELKDTLRNRSPYISLHDEDVSLLTDRVRVIFPAGGEATP